MTMPSLSLAQSLAIFAGTWFTWKLLKFAFAKDPFANIPGPPPDNWLTGEFCHGLSTAIMLIPGRSIGNLAPLLDKDNWEYHEQLVKKCKPCRPSSEPPGRSILTLHSFW